MEGFVIQKLNTASMSIFFYCHIEIESRLAAVRD